MSQGTGKNGVGLHGEGGRGDEKLFEGGPSPGLIVVAPPGRVVYLNAKARAFVSCLREKEASAPTERPEPVKAPLPHAVQQVYREIFDSIRASDHGKDLERFQLVRVVGGADRPFLIRGFGLAGEGRIEAARAVLLIEELAPRHEARTSDAMEQWRFTERERAVVECLSKGSTNREIAECLTMALPTVKEHIRHIMEKTGTSTRTGIVMRIFRQEGSP